MKLTFAILSAAMLGATSIAHAQSSLSGATLELRIVPVEVGSVVGNTLSLTRPGPSSDIPFASGTFVRRFEVQYRIVANGVFVAGLSSLQFNITASTSSFDTTNFSLDRALLTNFQGRTGNLQPGNTGLPVSVGGSDTTGPSTVGHTSLHRPYRGGIPAPSPNNGNAANGNISADGHLISRITPLALSQTDQNDGGFYGLYSFNLTVVNPDTTIDGDHDGFARINLTAAAIADAQIGNVWGGFEDGNPVPQTSRRAVNGTASVSITLPTPGSLTLVGIGGMVAIRRRRI